jgi:phosphate starvation-inducible membrane PsiE
VSAAERAETHTEKIGKVLVESFQFFALFVIGGTIVWSAVLAYWEMMQRGGSTVDDILLLFIYLELGAMVGIYFQTNRLPVQFLIYVAITILTRSLASSLKIAEMEAMHLLAVTGAVLILAVAVLVLRYASHVPPFISHVDSEGSSRKKAEEVLS